MLRIFRVALGLAVVLVTSTGEAQAQGWFGWYGPYGLGPGPGSTVEGDIARGWGYYNLGTGIYNHETAIAAAINAQTAYQCNQYLYLSQLEANRRHYLRLLRRQRRDSTYGELNYRRLVEAPTPADIDKGDALNVILDQVTDPSIHSPALRHAATPIKSKLLADIRFFHASAAVTISLGRLTAQKGWPIALRGETFVPERKVYQDAIARTLEEAKGGELSSQTVQAVRDAAARLLAMLKMYPPSDREGYIEAESYIETLMDMARGFDKPPVEKILAELATDKETTVGSLFSFMHAVNLRFGPAITPEQQVVYEELYPMLVAARDQIFNEADVKETSSPKAKKVDRFLLGNALGRQDDQTRRDPAARVSE